MKRANRFDNRGFSLAEVMLTVAILVVLFALAMIPISKYQKEFRQQELDSKAELVFTAVQNRMTQLQAAGMESLYAWTRDGDRGINKLGLEPWGNTDSNIGENTLCYVTSADKLQENCAAADLFPEGQADDELWNADWVVEYDPKGGSVYAVFYGGSGMAQRYSPSEFDRLRSRAYRISDGAQVGYYSGDTVEIETTGTLEPYAEIINTDHLQLRVICPLKGMTLSFQARIWELDATGAETGDPVVVPFSVDEVKWDAPNYVATMTLDSLEKGMRFAKQTRFHGLTPGKNLKITVTVTSDNPLVDKGSCTVTTNSLFADLKDGDTAELRYARHLQNLDQASELSEDITKAVQTRDIDFAGDADDEWKALYGDLGFTPVRNSNLEQLEGAETGSATGVYPVIYDLPVDVASDAGLIQSVSAGKMLLLKNIRLSGANVTGKTATSSAVGALVGCVNGALTLENCQVYLSRSHGHVGPDANRNKQWLQGGDTGGLVGRIEAGGSAEIQNSFAATTAAGVMSVGGLVGRVDGELSVTHSYADCYLTLEKGSQGIAGGLVGVGIDTATLKVEDAYAAGFLTADQTAGIAGMRASLTNVYTACALMTERAEGGYDTDGKLTYSTVTGGSAAGQVYYLCNGEENVVLGESRTWTSADRTEAAAELGDAFTDETSGLNTVRYELKVSGLSSYTFPRLKNLPHYGDWKAEFESGALAYYEYYADGSYGFYGGNIDTLKDTKAVLGDGYAAVYEGTVPPASLTVTLNYTVKGVQAKKEITLNGTNAVTVQANGRTYQLLRFSKEDLETAGAVDNYYITAIGNERTYSFNPHFAKTAVEGAAVIEKTAEQTISIRTARQLNNLSRYYSDYRDTISEIASFAQELNIDYSAYDWAHYTALGTVVTTQPPIGESEALSFIHEYDGGCHTITGVRFTDNGTYMGLFGYNRGQLRDIVLTQAVAADASGPMLRMSARMKTAYIGVLAGVNSGTITNCAVAGYQLQVQAYSASTVYAGGLVGSNLGGRIRGCSAEFPLLYAASTYAKLYVGGLVGNSSGQIRQSYVTGAVNIEEIKGGGVTLAGFAAENGGSIQNSYCAVSMISAGAETKGFTVGGIVRDCYYLNGGTYAFRGSVALYDAADSSGAQPVTDEKLSGQKIGGFGTVSASYDHAATDEENYPYPGSVTNAAGDYVHYGDWVMESDLGKLGVFYWEYETGGANNGYHISYIGFDGSAEKRGESLCETHDDGGVITRFGYGYYWKDGQTKPAFTTSKFCAGTTAVSEISEKLREQIPGYTFTAFESGENGLRLLSADERNAEWKLSTGNYTYTYSICPFFGNAFNYISGTGTSGAEDNIQPGTPETDGKGLAYQIRSADQLQFINWSYVDGTGSATRLVTKNNYKLFPYLQYTNSTGTAKQTRTDAERNRPAQSWQQTHDLNGANQEEGKAEKQENNRQFYPIAGAVDHITTNNSYSMVLYNWFGGSYDGGNYYIKNLNIESPCYNVGLFGTTAGVDIRNIVLYSDNNAVIQRRTEQSDWGNSGGESDIMRYQCAYAMGGLVGIAYRYHNDPGSVITNCAIAGYVIQDNSKNLLRLGEAVVGGLIGVSNLDLKQCSAVVDIQVNCTHIWRNDSGLNAAKYGNFIRVGGLVGGLRDKATDCYTGGKITVSKETLKERVRTGSWGSNNTHFADGSEAVEVKWPIAGNGSNANPATYVFIGGIGGSGFSANFQNFTGVNNTSADGAPKFYNCYTYINLPDMEGTITAISLIGSTADRYKYTTYTVENCYYLKSIKDQASFAKASKTYNPNNTNSMYTLLYNKPDVQEAMFKGNMSYLTSYLWETSVKYGSEVKGLTGLTYDQMAQRIGDANIQTANGLNKTFGSFKDALNNGRTGSEAAYDWVTTEEQDAQGNNIPVHGKYSFPGSTDALLGQDFPFPTVLRQEKQGQTMNLHYGTWPLHGLFWSKGIASMDLIADYKDRAAGSSIQMELKPYELGISDAPQVNFEYTDAAIVQVSAVWNADKKSYDVTLKGLKPGATEVTATIDYQGSTYEARLLLTVTAEITISTNIEDVNCYVGEAATMQLTAQDKLGKPLPYAKWSVTSSAPTVASAVIKDDTMVEIQGNSEGDAALTLQVDCELPGVGTFSASTIRSVSVRMQGILGVASDGRYWQGKLMKETATGFAGFDWAEKPAEVTTFAENAPACGEETLFLYAQGMDAALANYSVESVTVQSGTSSVEVAPGNTNGTYWVLPGAKQTSGDYTVLPLQLFGKSEGEVTLSVVLKDQRSGKTLTFEGVEYTIRPPLLHSVTYITGQGTSEKTETVIVKGDTVTLPKPGNAGIQSFLYWHRNNGDTPNSTEYPAGFVFPLTGDVIFQAVYK